MNSLTVVVFVCIFRGTEHWGKNESSGSRWDALGVDEAPVSNGYQRNQGGGGGYGNQRYNSGGGGGGRWNNRGGGGGGQGRWSGMREDVPTSDSTDWSKPLPRNERIEQYVWPLPRDKSRYSQIRLS